MTRGGRSAMNKIMRAGAIGMTLSGLCLPASAGTSLSGGAMLEQKLHPRAEAMGQAAAAMGVDESGAAGWNPAGLFFNPDQSLGAIALRGITDDQSGGVYYNQPISRKGALGAAVNYYDAGRFDVTTADSLVKQVAAQRDGLAVVTGAYQADILGQQVALGANLKALFSSLVEEYSAFTLAVDIGAMAEALPLLDNLFLGLAVRNLGLPIKYQQEADPLPLTALAGAAYQIIPKGQHQVVAALDASYDAVNHLARANLGLEYCYAETLAVRAGYKMNYALDTLTLGLGVRFQGIRLDYAFGLMNELNSTHRLGLSYTLSRDEQRRRDLETHPAPKPKPAAKPAASAGNAPSVPLLAKIAEVEMVSGVLKELILDVGNNKKVRINYEGTVYNAAGQPVAKIKICEVYPRFSRAKIIESSGDITAKDRVEITMEKNP